jgi:hypothetical protein
VNITPFYRIYGAPLGYPATSMRLSVAVACLLLAAGCVGPHASGGLWSLQNLEQELALSRLSDEQRMARARAVELALADEAVAAEWARIDAALLNCPGATRQVLAVSPGDRVRDAVRLRIQDDQTRLSAVAQVALADWRVRRARATGEARFCDAAQAALASTTPQAAPPNFLSGLGSATVTRDAQSTVNPQDSGPVAMSVSNYAMGVVDSVSAPSPLPQYLAAVYGGVVVSQTATNRIPVERVDELAPAYPEWEPDALYAALGVRPQ